MSDRKWETVCSLEDFTVVDWFGPNWTLIVRISGTRKGVRDVQNQLEHDYNGLSSA